MSSKKEYWQWKSTIIDFDTISDEKADFGDYWTKKDMIFQYLGTPDKEIHEWYNGGYSCEYNHALKYAKELGLVEEYIDYEDKLYEKDEEITRLNKIINKIKKLRNADTHIENIFYAEGVLLNEPYCDIEDVDNEELLDILRGDE